MQRDGGPGGGGPAGGGNPTGGSFTGPAEALEIAGDFAYAYSGSFGASTTAATRLSFTTGNYLFVGEIRLCGMIDETTAANGRSEVIQDANDDEAGIVGSISMTGRIYRG